MREVRRSALVPHTPARMYAIVNDVRRYPEFVPWCPATHVHEEAADSICATVEIARSGVRLAVTTRNTMIPGERIDLVLVDGPLQTLEGSWTFVPIRAAEALPGEPEPRLRGCRVELEVRFAFRNAALTLLFGPVFEASWDSLVGAFVRRAYELHGRG